MVIKKEVFNIRTNPKRFANNRPHGQEVVDWLREKLLSAYIPIFLHHGLDTLLSVKDLSREQVSRLTNEFRDIYTVACNKESVAWSTFGPSAVVDTDEQVGTMQSELHLWRAIRTLDRDSRARTMTERLEWFEDSAAAWHSRSEFTHPKHGPLPKSRWLTPKQSRLTHILTLTHEHTRSMGKIEHRTIHGASDNLHHAIRAIALESGGNAKKLCYMV
jgi:hypothetical protein